MDKIDELINVFERSCVNYRMYGSREWEITYNSDRAALRAEYTRVQQELAATKEGSGTCTWTASDDDEYWQTSCGEAFVVEDGTPKDNGMKYCPYCGKQLVERINENE